MKKCRWCMDFTWISRVVLDNDSLSLFLAENKFSSLGKKRVCMSFKNYFSMWKKSKFE